MIRSAVAGVTGATETLLSLTPGHPPDVSQARVIDDTENRPWRVPDEPWLMAQTWRDLLFAHWALPPESVRPALPPGLPLDTFDGRAWLGVTPFALTGLRGRGLPPIPGTARFPELNVRTYTTIEGRPGIYFLSLDAANPLAVAAARRTYRLPYFRAAMSIDRDEGGVRFRSRRVSADGAPAEFAAAYRPTGEARTASRGSLDYFLAERYCLYTTDDRGRVLRAEIQHPPWLLQPATATISLNSVTRPWGIELPSSPPLLHFARLQQVLIWPLRTASAR